MSIDTQSIITRAKKYPVLAVCGGLSIILLAVVYFRSGLAETQQAELDKFSAEGKRYRSNISNSSQLQEQLDFMIQANQAVRARALNADGLAENLQYFYRLESEVGVKYRDLRPGARFDAAKAKGATYVPLNYSVSVRGSFVQIITFLKSLEQGAYFCRINSASISSVESDISINLNLDLLGVQ
jgi:hypothetical protein